MLCSGRLGQAKFISNVQRADAVTHQIAVDLLGEMGPRGFEPTEDRHAMRVGKGAELLIQPVKHFHFTLLYCNMKIL